MANCELLNGSEVSVTLGSVTAVSGLKKILARAGFNEMVDGQTFLAVLGANRLLP